MESSRSYIGDCADAPGAAPGKGREGPQAAHFDPAALTDAIRRFAAPDEELSGQTLGLSREESMRRCSEGRDLARAFAGSLAVSAGNAGKAAAHAGCRVEFDSWETAGGQIEYLGEMDAHKRLVRVNMRPVRRLAARLDGFAAASPWDTARAIAGAVVAHELYHMLCRGNGGRGEEAAAHAFARALLRMPFSPLFFEWVLGRRRGAGPGTGSCGKYR